MDKGFIYKITNPNGKIYIGQTIRPIQRKSRYKTMSCKKQPKIYNSIKKYGWENHKWEIIDEVFVGYDNNIINIRESYWIHEYNSCDNGLNCDYGGRGGRKMSDDSKKKLSESLKGNGKGISKSKEHNLRNSISNRKTKAEKYGIKLKINGVIYDSIREASRQTGIPNTTLRRNKNKYIYNG